MSQTTPPQYCHVMAKPSGSVCNLDCEYCFYLEKEKLYPERNTNWKMSDDTLELFIKQQIDAQDGPDVDIAWQGGEPTLMGIEFYTKAVEFAQKYAGDKRVHYAFQTNGILINDEWCHLFKQHNFLIGISIDGPKDLHDTYRITRSGKGSFDKVMQGINCLIKHDIPFNTLTVVNKVNVKEPLKVYQFLKSIGSTFLQFIPLVERKISQGEETLMDLSHPDQDVESQLTDWSVPSWQYGEFLNQIFDQWVRMDVGRIFVQTFDSTLANWCGQPGSICIFSPTCGHALALEANGDLYSCDHYVYPEYKLGNIHNIPIREMNSSEQAIQFGQDKQDRLTKDCLSCEFRFTCHGGCPKHRFTLSEQGFPHHNYLCKGYYHFFKHTAPYMSAMRDLIANGRTAAEISSLIANAEKKAPVAASRNASCPCGSGKKFKRCCGK